MRRLQTLLRYYGTVAEQRHLGHDTCRVRGSQGSAGAHSHHESIESHTQKRISRRQTRDRKQNGPKKEESGREARPGRPVGRSDGRSDRVGGRGAREAGLSQRPLGRAVTHDASRETAESTLYDLHDLFGSHSSAHVSSQLPHHVQVMFLVSAFSDPSTHGRSQRPAARGSIRRGMLSRTNGMRHRLYQEVRLLGAGYTHLYELSP